MKTAFASIVPVRNCEKVIIRCSGRLVSEDEVRGRFVRKGDVLGDNCRVIGAVVSESIKEPNAFACSCLTTTGIPSNTR